MPSPYDTFNKIMLISVVAEGPWMDQSIERCRMGVSLVKLEGSISYHKEKGNENVLSIHSLMANLNLCQDVAKNRRKTYIAAHVVAKNYPLL